MSHSNLFLMYKIWEKTIGDTVPAVLFFVLFMHIAFILQKIITK